MISRFIYLSIMGELRRRHFSNTHPNCVPDGNSFVVIKKTRTRNANTA